jgi:hypothetical protein
MTDFYGVNYTKQFVNVPSEKIPGGEQSGRLRVAYDEYTFTAIIDTTDALYMMKIPENARLHEAMLKSADLGTTGDLNVGWQAGASAAEAADADGLFAAVDVNAAANCYLMSQAAAAPAGLHKKFAEEVQAVIVPSEITTATSGSISLALWYAIN